MKKILCRWQLAGFVFTSIAGALLHFLYDWSGKTSLIAVFSAVNESTWEHMKLLFVPMFLFAFAEYLFLGNQYQNFWFSKAAGLLLGLTLIPVVFYTWNGAFGSAPAWVNISLFFVAAAAAFALETRLLTSGRGRGKLLQTASLALFLLLGLMFWRWTFDPPSLPLFCDPTTKGCNIS